MTPFSTSRRRTTLQLLLVPALAGLCHGCARYRFRPAARQPSTPFDPGTAGPLLVDAHNRTRAERGLPALAENPVLSAAAQEHAEDMARRRRMSHRGSDGSSPFVRIERAGYRYTSAAENVAMGQIDVSEVVQDWMTSAGHRRNILGRFSEIGTGTATDTAGTRYWCVTFGRAGA